LALQSNDPYLLADVVVLARNLGEGSVGAVAERSIEGDAGTEDGKVRVNGDNAASENPLCMHSNYDGIIICWMHRKCGGVGVSLIGWIVVCPTLALKQQTIKHTERATPVRH
jgi:hypothetical protein